MKDFREYVAEYYQYDCGCWGEIMDFILKHPNFEVLGFIPSEPDESAGAALLKDGNDYYAFWEWQDYTGHGCQCGSGLSKHESLEAAWLFGLDEWARKSLQPQFPNLVNP